MFNGPTDEWLADSLEHTTQGSRPDSLPDRTSYCYGACRKRCSLAEFGTTLFQWSSCDRDANVHEFAGLDFLGNAHVLIDKPLLCYLVSVRHAEVLQEAETGKRKLFGSVASARLNNNAKTIAHCQCSRGDHPLRQN